MANGDAQHEKQEVDVGQLVGEREGAWLQAWSGGERRGAGLRGLAIDEAMEVEDGGEIPAESGVFFVLCEKWELFT